MHAHKNLYCEQQQVVANLKFFLLVRMVFGVLFNDEKNVMTPAKFMVNGYFLTLVYFFSIPRVHNKSKSS